mgnify:CR=1 FL=1
MRIPSGLIEICRLIRTGLVCALLFLGCAAGNDYPENIILFIGDGMGVAHITAGHTAAMVPLFAYGPGSPRLGGIRDNARVGRTLIELLLQKEIKN